MAYDFYRHILNDLKHIVVPVGFALPESVKREHWRYFCTMPQVSPTREIKIKKHGYDEYETTSIIPEPDLV